MDTQDIEGVIPDTENRPDYRKLRVQPQNGQATEEEQQKEKKRKHDQAPVQYQGLLSQVFSQLFSGSSSNDWYAQDRYSRQHYQKSGNAPVFTVPRDQEVAFAFELPGDPGGIAKEDSYLFMTTTTFDPFLDEHAQRHAFIVPKSDPSKVHEVSLSNIGWDTEVKHEIFWGTLGGEHKLVTGMSSSTLDGRRVRLLENLCEIDDLVRQPLFGVGIADSSGDKKDKDDEFYYNGESWIITQKDLGTGVVRKFTQSGTSSLGRLETFHDGESGQAQQDSSSNLVPLPSDMKEHAWADMSDAEAGKSYGGYVYRHEQALMNLVPDFATIKAQNEARDHELVKQLNAEEQRKKGQSPGNNWPVP